MVKVEEISPEEKRRAQEYNGLVDITRKLLGEQGLTHLTITELPEAQCFSMSDKNSQVDRFGLNKRVLFVRLNRVDVEEETYFSLAMQLVNAYEATMKREFTVRKDY